MTHVISSFTCLHVARKLAQVFGARRAEKAQPLLPSPDLGSHGRHHNEGEEVECKDGAGTEEVRMQL